MTEPATTRLPNVGSTEDGKRFLACAVESAWVTLDATRQYFPDSYFKRCMYSATCIKMLMDMHGYDANVCGGNLTSFVVRKDGTASEYGFTGPLGSSSCGHFWTQSQGFFIDLGVHHMPMEKGVPEAARGPLVVVPASENLPFLAYDWKLRLHPDGDFADLPFQEKIGGLLQLCRLRRGEPVEHRKRPWVLTGMESVRSKAASGDFWARGVINRVAKVTPG